MMKAVLMIIKYCVKQCHYQIISYGRLFASFYENRRFNATNVKGFRQHLNKNCSCQGYWGPVETGEIKVFTSYKL